MADRIGDGRAFRLLNVLNDFNREGLGLERPIWSERRGITIQHVEPGQPQQSACIERYNRTVRHEWLDQHIIETIGEAQDQDTQWLCTYNFDRPNMGIGGITPAQKLKTAA